jgi:hypothetical protein
MLATELRRQLRKFMILVLLLGCLMVLPIKNQTLAASQTCEDVCTSEFDDCIERCEGNTVCHTVCGVNVAECFVCCLVFNTPCF